MCLCERWRFSRLFTPPPHLQNGQKLPPPPRRPPRHSLDNRFANPLSLFSASQSIRSYAKTFSPPGAQSQSRTWQRLKSILSKHCAAHTRHSAPAGRGDDVTGRARADGHHTASDAVVIISAPPALEMLNTLDWRMRA